MASRFLIVLLVLFALAPVHAQESPQASFERARAEWDTGRFVEALERLERLMTQGSGNDLEEKIALLTGELFTVTELAMDGRAVRWSPDGRYGAYESGEGPGHADPRPGGDGGWARRDPIGFRRRSDVLAFRGRRGVPHGARDTGAPGGPGEDRRGVRGDRPGRPTAAPDGDGAAERSEYPR